MALRQLMIAKDISEALQVQAFLQSRGIEATVPDSHLNTILHYLQGSRILIDEDRYEEAIRALREIHVTPVDGYTKTAKEETTKKLNRALGASLLGILGIPILPNLYSLYLLLQAPRIYGFKFLLTLFVNVASLTMWTLGISQFITS